jgi:phosphatidylglycerophosphatase A
VIKPKSTPPPLSFVLSHPAHFVACGLGSGLTRYAPGTAGTVFAWATYPLLRLAYTTDLNFSLFLVLMFVFGVWCCHVTGKHLGVVDHGSIVWDEIVPFWAVLMMVPDHIVWQLAAFLWFWIFDIIKPPPAAWFDRRVKNGFGVMMDDVVAAGYAMLTLAVFKAVLEHVF